MTREQENAIKKFMAEKLAEKLSLSEIQRLVNEQFSCKLTYMDIRILASDLDNIDWNAMDPHAAERAKAEAKAKAKENGESLPGEDGAQAEDTAPGGGATVVELNKLARPGMALSGTVKFASGSTADWYVDNLGRLGLENLSGSKPTPEDIESFQIELERVIRSGR